MTVGMQNSYYRSIGKEKLQIVTCTRGDMFTVWLRMQIVHTMEYVRSNRQTLYSLHSLSVAIFLTKTHRGL